MSEFPCVGGPMDGQLLIRREDHGRKGVLLVDRPANECWVYEWEESRQVFLARNAIPAEVLIEGPVNRYRAAEEDNYDVVAAPWVVSHGDPGE